MPSNASRMRVCAATLARAYGVVGASGLVSESGPSLGAYSKHVPTPTSRAQPFRANETARLSATSSCAEFSGDVRYVAGRGDPRAVDADLGLETGNQRFDSNWVR